MAPEYPYIPVAGKYFCSGCNLVSLAWTLLVKTRSLNLGSLGIQQRQLPTILQSIVRHRKHAQADSTDILILPAFGHLCMRVHQGYKVFNLSKLTTTKIFDQNLDAVTAANEINSIRDASSLDFAPTLIEVDPGNAWYTETFCPGKRSSKKEASDPAAIYERIVGDHLSQMISSKPLRTTELAEYLHGTRDSISQRLTNFDNELSRRIDDFVRRIATRLEASTDSPIQLAFTHGDFSFVNFLYRNSDITVIDWESARQRSILHDLYNYFLTELYYGRIQSNLSTPIDDAISSLIRRLVLIDPEFPEKLIDSKDTYRWLYYLERLLTLLDREPSSGQMNVINRSIDTFDKHESRVSDQHQA
jgi:hypothetical protein